MNIEERIAKRISEKREKGCPEEMLQKLQADYRRGYEATRNDDLDLVYGIDKSFREWFEEFRSTLKDKWSVAVDAIESLLHDAPSFAFQQELLRSMEPAGLAAAGEGAIEMPARYIAGDREEVITVKMRTWKDEANNRYTYMDDVSKKPRIVAQDVLPGDFAIAQIYDSKRKKTYTYGGFIDINGLICFKGEPLQKEGIPENMKDLQAATRDVAVITIRQA